MIDFVHLHLHTEYSLLDGACRVDALLDQAARLKMPALAVTEHGNLFSAIRFHDRAKRCGVKPILGCEVYVAHGDRRTKSGAHGEMANHLVLLAETTRGYHNLLKLVSAGYTEGFSYKPRIDKDLLEQHAAGLIGLSGCLKGEVALALCADRYDTARAAAGIYRDMFGPDNFFLEMQDQGIEAQKAVNAHIPKLAAEVGLPIVCTNDVHYLTKADSRAHDVLLCIGTGKTVQDADRLRYHGDQFYLKTPEEMAQVFGEYPDALANTVRIAERCTVEIDDPAYRLPDIEVPEGTTLDAYFEQVVRDGFKERLPRITDLIARGLVTHTLDSYETRLSREIQTIAEMRCAGHFLIVWDVVRFARARGIRVGPGRGAAAGSLVAWCLRITEIDPIQFDLSVERFLDPTRLSTPDIDLDLCERRRGEVIEYVARKYGPDHVAQIGTFGTMKAKAVIRDVGRALNLPYPEVDKVAKLIPATPDMTLERALADSPALTELETADAQIRELLEVGRRLEGTTRHISVHAGGVVIAPKPLTELVPLYKGPRDQVVTQWAMKELERLGLLTIDFLGLNALTLLDDCVTEIARTTGRRIDLEDVPMDDAKTYELLGSGQTAGVFGFESAGMREVLRKAKPSRFADLIEHTGYAFRPHATACAWLAYRTAYLKANYPWPFMAALLTLEAHEPDQLALYLDECRELGVPVLAPDLNASAPHFTVAADGVRFGLATLKNLGDKAIRAILAVRTAHGRIDTLDRLCEHADLRLLNKRVLESLVKSGACDSLYGRDAAWTAQPIAARRARLLAGIDQAIEHGTRRQDDRDQGQSFLFGADMGGAAADDEAPTAAATLPSETPWTQAQLLAFEKETLGLYLSSHPLVRYANDLKAIGARRTGELAALDGTEGTIGGIISGCRIVRTRKGDRMAVFMIEDLEGAVEVIVYSEPYKQFASMIENDAMVLVKGRIELDEEGRPKVRATELQRMSQVTERFARSLHVRMVAPPCGRPTFEALADVFSRHRGDRRVTFELEITNREHPVRIHADVPRVRVRPSERLVAEVERICGAGSATIR